MKGTQTWTKALILVQSCHHKPHWQGQEEGGVYSCSPGHSTCQKQRGSWGVGEEGDTPEGELVSTVVVVVVVVAVVVDVVVGGVVHERHGPCTGSGNDEPSPCPGGTGQRLAVGTPRPEGSVLVRDGLAVGTPRPEGSVLVRDGLAVGTPCPEGSVLLNDGLAVGTPRPESTAGPLQVAWEEL